MHGGVKGNNLQLSAHIFGGFYVFVSNTIPLNSASRLEAQRGRTRILLAMYLHFLTFQYLILKPIYIFDVGVFVGFTGECQQFSACRKEEKSLRATAWVLCVHPKVPPSTSQPNFPHSTSFLFSFVWTKKDKPLFCITLPPSFIHQLHLAWYSPLLVGKRENIIWEIIIFDHAELLTL